MVNKRIQLIELTPEELGKNILDGVKKELQELKKNFQPKEPPEYLTRQEVADMLKVDLSTVHNWCKRKILFPVGIGARVYFRRDQVEKAIVELEK